MKMAISHHDQTALKPIANNVSLSPTSRRSSTIRLLAYTIMLGCVLGILQPSAIGASAASALPRPVHSEDLNVVGIGGQRHIGDSYGFHSEASESHRGERLRKRYAAGEIQDDQGSNDIKAGVNDKQISQTNTQPAAPLTTQTIKDENQSTSTTIPLTEVITSEKIEGTITQSAAEKTISATEVQNISTPTETIGQNTDLFTSESLVPQISETSLQSGPSPTIVNSQKPTTGSAASSSLTSNSGEDLSQATSASIEPKIPASAVSVSIPTFSLAILPSGKASDTLVSTSLIATPSQAVPEASTTTIESEATLAPEGSASSTEPVLSVTQEITIPDITPSPNQFTTELPAQSSSVEESFSSLTTTTKTTPAFVPTGIAIVGDTVDAVDGIISPILDTAKGVLPVIPSNALSEVPSATTSLELVTTVDKALGSTAVPKTNISPIARIEEVGEEDVTTTAQPSPTEISISSGAQTNDQVRASQTGGPTTTSETQRNDQSQTSVSSDPGPTTTSGDNVITTATPAASNSTNTQGLPLNTTKAAATDAVLIEIPTSNAGDTITTELAPTPSTSDGSLQPQSTEVPTSTGIATDASTTTTNTLATSATTSVATITTPVTTDVSTAITASVVTPVTSSATATTSTTGITSTTDVTTGNTAIITTSTSASETVSITTSTPDTSFTSTSITATATTSVTIDVTSVSSASVATTSSSTGIFTGSGTTTSITISESTTFTTESSTVTQPTSSSVGDSTTSTATSRPEQASSSASLQVLPVITGAVNTTSTASSAAATTTGVLTTEESSTASSSVVQSSTPLSSLSQTSEFRVPTGTSTQTTTSTETAESTESTSISSMALQSVTIGSSSSKSATNPTTFITATSGATKPSIISSSSLSTDSSKTVKGSPSEGANSNPPQTAPAVTPTPATPVDVPEVVVPITRASDIPPSAEVTAGNTVDKDGNKVQIVAFYDATSGETFGTDRATVFEGSAVDLSISFSLIFAVMTALVGQLFFL